MSGSKNSTSMDLKVLRKGKRAGSIKQGGNNKKKKIEKEQTLIKGVETQEVRMV